MGLWALTTAAVQGLKREYWGAKIADQTGELKDTLVQPAIEELVARLASKDPITMPGSLDLIAPVNDTAIQITIRDNGDGDGGDGITIINEITNTTLTINETIEITNNITNETTVIGGPGSGFTGSFTYVKSSSVAVVGCTVTITDTLGTIVVKDGLVQSVS